jgi:hypothetical protein
MNKFITAFVILMIACIVYFQSCKEEEPLITTGGIIGKVTDAETKNPLKGVSATITPGGSAKVTNEDGAYSFDNLDVGEYILVYAKDDYEVKSTEAIVKANDNTVVDIALMPIKPALTVSTETLDFGTTINTLPIDISNSGKGTLSWNISYDSSWFSCSPKSGNTGTGISPVVVTVSRTGKERGSYTQVLTISSNGGSKIVTLSMKVGGIALGIEPQTLDFGSLTSSMQLMLSNNGTGSIDYTVETSNAWITLSKAQGSITRTDYVTVIVNRELLSSGSYTGAITIKSGIESFVIPVTMEIAFNEKPMVSFDQIKNVAYNSAVLSGAIISVGSATVTRYGFCWSTKPTPTVENDKTNLGDCSNPLAFESTAINLEHSTKYYVRAYAENSVGLSYSTEKSFTTAGLPTVPTVETGIASAITASTATIGGTVSNLGNEAEVTQYGHVWGVNPNPAIDLATRTNLGTLNVTGQYASDIEGLLPNVQYHVRAYATNSKGTAYGNDITFTTTTADATIVTADVTDIVHNAATCGGSITFDGGHTITERGVCWAITSLPTVSNNTMKSSSVGTTFSCRITGLATTTTYHVRSYIRTQSGAVYYGANKTFTTTQVVSLPTVATTTVSNIGTERATLTSSITGTGNSTITDCGFVYATWRGPTIEAAEKASCGTGTTNFGKSLTELTEGVTYYVRAYAVNAMGTAYGEEISFSTLATSVPTLADVNITGIGNSNATTNSSITATGNTDVTDAGFCWSENPYPTIYDNKISSGTGTTLSANITGLKNATTYYVRAYATNSKGTGYSADAKFTTEDPQNMRYYVSVTTGDNNNDGRSWATAKKTISAAVMAAKSGYQVWVDNATYQEDVTLKDGIGIYGGFIGSETSIEQRGKDSRTVILRKVITSQDEDFSTTAIVDGFQISSPSATVNIRKNCEMNNCVLTGSTVTPSLYIYADGTVTNSNIDGVVTIYGNMENCSVNGSINANKDSRVINTVTTGTINVGGNGVRIERCQITVSTFGANGYGIKIGSGTGINIDRCQISCHVSYNNKYDYYSYGIYISSGTKIKVEGCKIFSTYSNVYIAWGGSATGIYVVSGAETDIINCTINSNFYGIRASGTSNIANCIVVPVSDYAGVSSNNNGYVTNTIANSFSGVSGRGNIKITSVDLCYLDSDLSPQSGSPAINAGDNSFVTVTKDINGNTRIQNGTVDIGAVESSF